MTALLLAACGGGDASLDTETPAPDAATPSETVENDGSGEVDEAALPEADPSDAPDDLGDSGASTGLGPALEPVSSFVVASAFQPVGYSIAVAPSGDRAAAMWISQTDFQTNLAIYDASSGSELAAITDDRLNGNVLWTADDRIITYENFARLQEWDSGDLAYVSENPLLGNELDCSGGNGAKFDPRAGALFLKSDSLCRIDVATCETVQFVSENRTALLAVAIGGNEVYLRGTDSAGDLVLLVLDATALDIVSDELADGPNPVIAASGNGKFEKEPGGFGYIVQASGRVVDFDTAGITTSDGGGYYVARFDDGMVIVSSTDGSTIGTIGSPETPVLKTAWSADDRVMAAFTDAGVSVFAIG